MSLQELGEEYEIGGQRPQSWLEVLGSIRECSRLVTRHISSQYVAMSSNGRARRDKKVSRSRFDVNPGFADAKLPAAEQRKALTRPGYLPFLEMRMLGREGKATQVADLAEAFHNLPLMMWHPEFSMRCQRDFLARYHKKHGARQGFNYVAALDKVRRMKGRK
jgi:hypothetical protein